MRAIYIFMLFCSLLVSCEETPEYPDENFNIVGTWEYNIPPHTGSAPSEGTIYNALGHITFTEDNRFSFVIESDNGKVKGYGTYIFDEDSGIHLIYEPYKKIEIEAREMGYPMPSRDIYQDYIAWGNEGDRMEDDYMLVHSVPVKEYRRVETRNVEDEVSPYRSPDAASDDDWYLVSHSGTSFDKLPDKYVELYLKNQ